MKWKFVKCLDIAKSNKSFHFDVISYRDVCAVSTNDGQSQHGVEFVIKCNTGRKII